MNEFRANEDLVLVELNHQEVSRIAGALENQDIWEGHSRGDSKLSLEFACLLEKIEKRV